MAAKLGVPLLFLVLLPLSVPPPNSPLLPSFVIVVVVVAGLANALIGLAKAHPQLLLLPWASGPAGVAVGPFGLPSPVQDEDDEVDDNDDVIMNPPKRPPQRTFSRIVSPAAREVE